MSEQIIVVKTNEQLDQLIEYLQDKDVVAYDTETTGVEKGSTVIGFSICADVSIGYYVILSYWDVANSRLLYLETHGRAKELLELLKKKSLIMHNAVFDCMITNSYFGIELMPYVHTDTMILGHLLDENRSNGLKERGEELFGENARKEQKLMKESVERNGGMLTKAKYELYKADADLIAHYGAKDAILTLKIFYHDLPILFEEGLDQFFYQEESMPLLRGPTYDLNTTGLKVNAEKLSLLKKQLEADCLEAKSFIYKEIDGYVKDKYPGTLPRNTFNIGAGKQLAWLLFERLQNEIGLLTDSGKIVCRALGLPIPYTRAAKRDFIEQCTLAKDSVYEQGQFNYKTGKVSRDKKISDYWAYTACGKETLGLFAQKYVWVQKLLEYAKNLKLLNTYVIGIQNKMAYSIIRPSFLQHGTTSGRYSSKNPNFQNLPRDDKRVKACIEARPGNVFVGADQSQLEPRVFASTSQDETLMKSFASGEDFYSVVGSPVWGKTGLSLVKNDPNSFAKKHPDLRDKAKVLALATPYGRTARQQAAAMKITVEESEVLINRYFEAYPKVELMMLESHHQAMNTGQVLSLFGRPRRIPAAKDIPLKYGNKDHNDLPYEARTLLNLAMNHRVQSTGASIMNRAAIACWNMIQDKAKTDPKWGNVKIVLQVHDELVLEGPESIAEEMAQLLKYAMEKTVTLPGVELIAEPKIAKNLADLK